MLNQRNPMIPEELNDIFKIGYRLQELRGIPQFFFIDSIMPQAAINIRRQIIDYKTKNPAIDEIDVIVQSSGGVADDAYRIIRTFRKNFNKVNIIVPFWAKSAATLLCLGGTTIIMDEFAEFGPLDVQIEKESDMPDSETQSALLDEHSLNRIVKHAQEDYHSMFINLVDSKDIRITKTKLSEQLLTYIAAFYSPLIDKLNPYEIGAKARFLSIGETYAVRILVQFNSGNLSKPEIDKLVDYLVHGCPDHGYIVDYDVISVFLQNVLKSEDLGTNYCKTLTELSLAFLTISTKIRYTGFLTKAPEPVQDIKDDSMKQTPVKVRKTHNLK